MTVIKQEGWDGFLKQFHDVHILQTSAWGKLKGKFGWETTCIIGEESGAQVLFRRLPAGFCAAYIPKGPVGNASQQLWEEIFLVCKKKRSIFLKIEPDIWEAGDAQVRYEEILPTGFQITSSNVQPRKTILVHINVSETEILNQMKQKTRYNIRLAQRKNVTVKQSKDVATFYSLMDMTGKRDQFGIHSINYYQSVFDIFSKRDECVLLIAEYESEPIASLMILTNNTRAWYFYGASSNAHRDKMSTYLLHWEAILWAKAQGCEIYDFWGIPDEPDEILEGNFLEKSGELWGVYRFKRGFGGEKKRSIGSWDMVFSPVLYNLIQLWRGNESNG